MSNEQLTVNNDHIAVIVLAAGSSRRMGGLKKEFLKLVVRNPLFKRHFFAAASFAIRQTYG